MFDTVKKLHTESGTVISGLADFSRMSPEMITSLAGTWKNPAGQVCKAGSSTVAYISDNMFIKCSPSRSAARFLRRMFGVSRAMRSLKMSLILKKNGIITPDVLCAVREKRFFLPLCDYLVTEKLNTDIITFGNKCNQEQWDTFFSLGCRLLKKMHDINICHGDASVRNFYMLPDENNSYNIGAIDLDACRKITFFQKKNRFVKEDARFISSFIISSGTSETVESIQNTCIKFMICRGENPDNAPEKLQKLLKLTFRYLKKTRRYYPKGA